MGRERDGRDGQVRNCAPLRATGHLLPQIRDHFFYFVLCVQAPSEPLYSMDMDYGVKGNLLPVGCLLCPPEEKRKGSKG